MELKLTEKQKEKILQLSKKYPRKEDFPKIRKFRRDFVARGRGFTEVIYPFLLFLSEDEELKTIFSEILNSELGTLPKKISELNMSDNWTVGLKNEISSIVEPNFPLIMQLENLIYFSIEEENVDDTDY